ncbi:hypothetical protein CSQ93_21590 [Janthinobacterium sp. BJB426]|nr:hypothetical protein CSQ93_21590 [Janthinobacterium sp. BJB426]
MAKRLRRNSTGPCLARAVTQVIRICGSYQRVPANALGLKVSFSRDQTFLHDELHCGLDNCMKCAVWRIASVRRKSVIFWHHIRSLFEIK